MHLKAYIASIRMKQWLKNLMVFFPPLLSGAFLPMAMMSRGFLPFLAFCFASSSTYLFNDIIDRRRDAAHPVKSLRPIAAGRVPVVGAVVLALLLAVFSVLLSLKVSSTFLLYVAVYMVVSVAYTLLFKDMPIIDVFCIALGFVLRLYGGGEAFNVQISDWLFLSVFLLAIFLSFGKRFSEQRILGEVAGSHRKTLEEYPEKFLESALYLSGATVLVTYSMYAITRPVMVYTVPLCMFGLLRYLMRIQRGDNGDPTESLLKDFPLLVTGVIWLFLVTWSIYQ